MGYDLKMRICGPVSAGTSCLGGAGSPAGRRGQGL
jgi:hypothetical protein